jgi:alcohol dehydrogenase class IV
MRCFPSELILPPVTISGSGSVKRLIPECAEFGRTGVLVHGASLRTSGALDRILDAARGTVNVTCVEHEGGEPTLEQVEAVRAAARDVKALWVAAIGGGSVMDVAKAAAGLFGAPLAIRDYHDGADIPPASTPFVAAPTTAGTGSEATFVTVLTNAQTNVKKSIRHPSFLARRVILDPDLLRSCPPSVLAASGMDAFTQAVESFLSRYGTWFTRELALEAAARVHSSLPVMFAGFSDNAAGELLYGSYLAGVALSNSRLGLVHGLAHPLGARYGVSHGLACAICLPPVLEFNRSAAPELFRDLHNTLSKDVETAAADLLSGLLLTSPFKGRALTDLSRIVDETLASGSTKANPRDVAASDVESIVIRLFARGSFSDSRAKRAC